MLCPSCDAKKAMKVEVITHRFKESGLDNVILDGVKHYRCGECGESIYDYGDLNQLNRVIAETLLRKDGTLSGKEIRYLRSYVGYSSEMFAKILGYDKTSWSRIENERSKISNQVNMSVRWAVAGKLADRDYDIHDLVLAVENEKFVNFNNVRFKAARSGWQLLKGA
jgi:putative zinc finger/helix-turn-helix YgiT family protein